MCVAVPPRAARRRTRASLGAVTAADYNILINKTQSRAEWRAVEE